MTDIADRLIASLGLSPHPEGGYFREMYRSPMVIPAAALPARFGGSRSASTAIYFLLRGSEHSAMHRLRADEVWHHYQGSSVTLHEIHPDGKVIEARLGEPGGDGAAPQHVVLAGCWFGATVDNPQEYALVGCTVAPGFTPEDFELGNPTELVAQYPQHEQLIRRLAPSPGWS
jgi:predicted cupin superfamily sugar epimerase